MDKKYLCIDIQKNDVQLLLVLTIFTILAFTAPVITQPLEYHGFADSRGLFGIPRTMDVLTNIGFLVAGVYGLFRTNAMRRELDTGAPALYWSLMLFFLGVALTALGSAYYHIEPNSMRLVWDRLPMTLAFGGICGALASATVSRPSGWIALVFTTAVGLSSIIVWHTTGNLTPYVAIQFGGLLWVAYGWVSQYVRSPSVPHLPWGSVLLYYAIAKATEHWDISIFEITQGWISGHSLKHVFATFAAVAVACHLRGDRWR